MTTDDYLLRWGEPADFDVLADMLGRTFHERWGPELRESMRGLYEPGRTVVAVGKEGVVGSAGSFTRALHVPGGPVPAAHVSMVGVDLGHRRRGLLSRMMARQLSDIAERGEPLAVLWASEGSIYQRYGYGLAVNRLTIDLRTDEIRLIRGPEPKGRVRVVEVAQARESVRAVYDRVSADRPGWSGRDRRWWDRVLSGVTSAGPGATPLQALLYEDDAGPAGYALWRVRPGWNERGADGTVVIREMVAGAPEAYRALWAFLLDISLTRTVQWRYGSADEPLFYLVEEPRRLGARLIDQLWLRMVDVPGALAARRYLVPVDVVIEVTDPLLPANTGRWHLTGGPDGAECRPTRRDADLVTDPAGLGAGYLGGVPLAALAAAGRLTEARAGALRKAGPAFGWNRPPSTMETF